MCAIVRRSEGLEEGDQRASVLVVFGTQHEVRKQPDRGAFRNRPKDDAAGLVAQPRKPAMDLALQRLEGVGDEADWNRDIAALRCAIDSTRYLVAKDRIALPLLRPEHLLH